MPVLATGRAVISASPTLLVENQLAAGAYRFELVCVDDAGNVSEPARISVTVNARPAIDPRLRERILVTERITPVLTPLRPRRPGE